MILETLRGKLAVGFCVLLGLLGLTVVHGRSSLIDVRGSLETLYGRHYETSLGAAGLTSDLNEVRASLLTMMAVEGADRERTRTRLQELTKEIDGAFPEMIQRCDPTTATHLQLAQAQWVAFRDTRDQELIPAIDAGKLDEARALALGVQRERYLRFAGHMRDAVAAERKAAEALIERARAQQDRVELTSIAIGAGAVAAAIVLALLVKSATDRIRTLTRGSAQLAGDRDVEGSASGDEIAQLVAAFTRMVESSAQVLDAGARDVQRSLTELAAGYAEQSTAVSETVTTLDQLRAAAVSGSDRSKDIIDQSRHASEVARKGNGAVSDVTEGMKKIRAQVEQIASSVLDLSERAQRIGEIVESVNGIADQSKLLALNAAIEAAKAGEYGHGFAVVADEVRVLAERSQGATREIGAILKEIQRATNASVMATEDGSKAVDRGLQLVDTARGAIQGLSTTVDTNSKSVEQIAHSVRQQSVGITQISEAMNGIVVAVRQGNDESTRIKEAMGGLVQRVDAMREVLQRFRAVA